MNAPLAGKVALVTGASRGIGFDIAVQLAEAGANLVLTSTSEGGCTRAAQSARALGRKVLTLSGDVARPDVVDRWVAAAQAELGHVDVLVNNAGIVVRKPLAQMMDDDFTRVLDVNLAGPFLLARRLIPAMAQRGWGRVVNVSSISSTLGSPRASGYCASKWGLNGLTQALAEEYKGTGVVVTAVLPGSVDTEMLQGSGFAPAMSPRDVASVVRFLCCEAPAAMTGSLVECFG